MYRGSPGAAFGIVGAAHHDRHQLKGCHHRLTPGEVTEALAVRAVAKRRQREQAGLEDEVTSAELALETTKAEMAQFQRRYYQTVGRLYA
ncbi:hypothetical protein CR51_31205 [Caballeronia megalochromosomata]|nr:hypothetical protein CR51_31205 [Caballeronia megalochromosomata]